MTIKSPFLLVFFYLILLTGCKSNRLDVSVDALTQKIHFVNVDKALATQNIDSLKYNFKRLDNELTDLFAAEITFNLRQPIDSLTPFLLHKFYNSDYVAKLEKEKAIKFKDLSANEKEIEKAFAFLKHYFKDMHVPTEVLWMNNLFAGVHSSDSAVCVGLENYLGKDIEVIKNIPNSELYDWQRKRMDAKFIARDVLESWIQSQLFRPIDAKLVEHIVQAGKTLYLVEASFPKANQALIIKYTADEFAYAEKNELAFWDYLVKEKLLFTNTQREKANMLNAGPYTVGISEDAPDRMGQFLGWQMVRGYMNQNEDVSLQELLKTDYNTILQSYEID